ncbi:MAG: hypothetical protein JJU10_01810 [Idiomarina sp.]|nr:hypothetical protein [Idiomarina sp.]
MGVSTRIVVFSACAVTFSMNAQGMATSDVKISSMQWQQDCGVLTQPLRSPSQLQAELTASPSQTVSFLLKPALLRPQLEELLATHWQVQRVIWYAAQDHLWPTHFELIASDWDALLERLLTPYQLRVVLHANHTAVVDYLPQALQR